jgi:hypothetical protein
MSKTTSTQKFELSDDHVKEAITEWIEKQFGKGKPITVSLSAKTITTGIGPGEHDIAVVEVSASREL